MSNIIKELDKALKAFDKLLNTALSILAKLALVCMSVKTVLDVINTF